MTRNPEKPQVNIYYKEGKVIAHYRYNRSTYPIRIARTSDLGRGLIRYMHATMRIKGAESLKAIDLFLLEFGELLIPDSEERDKKFLEFMDKLSKKPFEQLGVNV